LCRYGSKCPDDAFQEGRIIWDDEDSDNINHVKPSGQDSTVMPSGEYDRNTKIDFCCRNDGSITTPMLLPTANSFVLWQYQTRGCQRVRGMNSRELFILWDDEDDDNIDSCSGSHPYNENCSRNHHIWMCHYYR